MNINLCRACLDNKSSVYPLYEIYEHNLTLAMLLESLLSVKLSKEDSLPEVLCEQCTEMVVQFYNFSLTYAHNDKKLKASIISVTEDDIHTTKNSNEEEQTYYFFKESPTAADVVIDSNHKIDFIGDENEISLNVLSICNKKILGTTPQTHLSNRHTCIVCKEMFSDKKSLNVHYESHKTYLCDICGASFIRKTYLNDHYDGHRNVYSYKCKFCGKAFKRRTVLVKHNRIHTNVAFCICEMCGRSFKSYDTLKTHQMLLHIRERNFECPICNKRFPLKATLNKHIKRHKFKITGEKEFLCDKCDMMYCHKHSLKRHLEYKHGKGNVDNNRHTCNSCDKKYSTQTKLCMHQEKIHSEISFFKVPKEESLEK